MHADINFLSDRFCSTDACSGKGMKGVHIGIDFLGRLLVTIFIIGIIVVLMYTWLPEYIHTNCTTKQSEKIGDIVREALSASSRTVRDFTVDSCMESVDFSPNLYCSFPNQGRFSDTSIARCYEMYEVGQNSGNCVDYGTHSPREGDIYAVYLYEKAPKRDTLKCKGKEACKEELKKQGYTDKDIEGDGSKLMLKCEGDICEINGDGIEFVRKNCGDRKGTIRKLPADVNVLNIDTSQVSSGKLKKGKYSVEIGPYSIKFLAAQSSAG